MKVTAIKEAHDITTLDLDELFGSLLRFEMPTADRESMDVQTSNQYRRKNYNGPTRRNNENSDRRSDGYLKKKEGDRKIFRCRECGGVSHYQAECTTFLRKLKKNFRVTLSDEESVDSRVDDGNINAFAVRITDENTDDDSECSVESKNDELSIEKLQTLWKEDCEARAIQKERIQDLLEENELLMSVISSLKLKLRETADDAWYFDSGCSKYMTGNRSYFTNLNDCVTEHVTFGDVAKGKIIAKVDKIRSNMVVAHKAGACQHERIEKGIKNKAVVGIPDLDSLGTVTMDLMGPMQTESLGAHREYCQKWDARSEQGIFLGYSQNSRAYRVYNNRSDSDMETINVVINDLDSDINQMNDEEDDTPNMYEVRTTSTVEESKADNSSDGPGKSLKKSSEEIINKKYELILSAHVKKNHPASSIIGDSSVGMQTRRKDKIDYLKMVADLCYISTIEPSTIGSALKDEYWLNSMQEELLQFRQNNVWTLVSKPEGVNVIGVDFDETFAPVPRLEEVYVPKPKGFVDSEPPKHVYKLNKALYGLKQALKAWYDRLTVYLRGSPQDLVNNFINIMQSEFETSMVGEFSCFLGLQIKQKNDGIFISQEKYARNMVKKFGLEQARNKRTPAATHVILTKDTKGAKVDHKLYKSIVGSLLYLTANRPDIAYAIGICARYQADPHITHLEAVKRILKYVHGTSDFGMMYSYDTTPTIVGYCDADWAGSADDPKTETKFLKFPDPCLQPSPPRSCYKHKRVDSPIAYDRGCSPILRCRGG
ncbi:gag-pol polyprotein [Cucumis melo var. makuwa]|uniref:Gag-pol polyprotein n=1 Tax=Cucumis melo var. makuwa TaxID=1194695 RepID=A0A5A7THK0_CUCMM|nr:gag-pol polyprotein [Cucumis melo var. makuwa]